MFHLAARRSLVFQSCCAVLITASLLGLTESQAQRTCTASIHHRGGMDDAEVDTTNARGVGACTVDAGASISAATVVHAGAGSGAGAGAGSDAVVGAPPGATRREARHYSAIVVGAGLAGATAAHSIVSRHPTATVLVVEASRGVGGRLRNMRAVPLKDALDGRTGAGDRSGSGGSGGIVYDLGAAWTWPSHDRNLARVAKAAGVATVAQYGDGAAMSDQAGRWRAVRASVFSEERRFVGGAASIPHNLLRLAQDTRRVDVVTGFAVDSVSQAKTVADASAPVVSVHAVATSSASSRGSDLTATSDVVILAAAPRLVQARVVFDPALPSALATAMRATPVWMADTAKLAFVFSSPFWRDMGLSGSAFSRRGPIQQLWDNTQEFIAPSGSLAPAAEGAGEAKGAAGVGSSDTGPQESPMERHVAAPAALSGFVFGADAMQLGGGGKAAGGVVRRSLEQLQGILGAKNAGACIGVVAQAWPLEEWIAPPMTSQALAPPSSAGMNGFGARELRVPQWDGALLLAGTETEDEAGHMEGAALSGLRAAEAAVKHLKRVA